MTLVAIAVGGFALIAVGLLRLQVVEYERYLRLSQENRVRLEVLRAPRGAIYDRDGQLLADNTPSFRILFRPFPAESTHYVQVLQRREWVERVAALVDLDTMRVRQLVRTAQRSGKSVALMDGAPFERMAAAEEDRMDLPGIEVLVEPMRRYPHGVLAAHLLGYAGEINDRELAERTELGYRPGDLIGRSGVERSYEEVLRGQDGAEFVVVNAMGQRVSTLSEGPPRPPTPGRNLTLTLDLDVQRALEKAMEGVGRGAAVAIDPRNGGILAMVSRPAFDPNEFAHGLSRDRWSELSSGGANPLLNRVIQGAYPPGSTFKIVSMLAALQAGVAQPASRFQPCTGRYFFGGRSFGCWKREGHGSLDFVEAIQHSCDVYFYQVGPRLGLARMGQEAHQLGLGDRTGVDLPQERAGLIPDDAWYEKRRMGAFKGTLLNLVIGQGELLATPLQLAVMTAEVANGGHRVRPHVVRGVDGTPEPARAEGAGVAAGPEALAAVRRGLELVVESGTGTAARVPGIRVAGKTGTAQNPHGEDHALFVCYAPAENPEIVLAIVVENSGHGGSIAAPRAGAVLRALFAPQAVAAPLTLPPPDTSEASRGD